ncbi:MAG: TonB-dependent receptor [Tannerellaceae bacterium]|jgi:outer membrane receptor for ferrienterochelin and colicin|nr:TonB-dependent receptor [Tannerellaceae bacterium]
MKRTLALLAGLLIFPPGACLHAQSSEPTPVVTLEMYHVPAPDMFLELEKQTGMFFSYESSLPADIPPLSLKAKDEPLSYCLKRLFASLPITYRITGQYIILKRKPRQYTISGFVRDSASYESLINAAVQEVASGKGSVSNSYGFYSITLTAGKVKLRSSYVGYKTHEITLTLDKDTLVDMPLAASGTLQEVVVSGNDPYSEVMNSRMGNAELSSAHIRKAPVLFGEPDLLRCLHHEPGVASGTEILGGMFVRGGNQDENLFLIDGIPLYNVNHVGGLFSTFNPDVVKNVDFYKGSFPARYGGRLSSVADVRLKDGDMQHYHGNVSLGLLMAKAMIEGPIVKGRTSFNIAFRRTWFDALTAPLFAIANKADKYGNKHFMGYSFYDLNAKLNHTFSPQSSLYANFYMGQDRLRSTEWYKTNDKKYGQELIWRWGNIVSSLNWTYLFSRNLFGNFKASYSQFKTKMIDNNITPYDFDPSSVEPFKEKYYQHRSGIRDAGFRSDFDYSPTPRHRIRFGSDYLYHVYTPEDKYTAITTGNPLTRQNYEQGYSEPLVYAHEWGVYAEDDWLLADKWKANAGVRLGAYHVEGKSYLSFQPHLSARYLITNNLSLKASYAKTDQYVHQLSNTFASLPSDIWVPVTPGIKPMNACHVSAGAYYKPDKKYDFSMEGYYKTMNNLIEYQDNALLYPDYVGWDKKVSMGSGRSYGIEVRARKPEGRTSGWIAYTLSWSDRIFTDKQVNRGERFPFKYDNRHKLNLTVLHKFSPKTDLSASWTYASGNRVTIPLERYASGTSLHDDAYFDYVLGRNAAKLGDYHRLDLSLNIYLPKKKGRMGIWNISLYNAYCRMNPFYITQSYFKENGKLATYQRGLVPVIPSVSYTCKF